jgi:hypothetical protein
MDIQRKPAFEVIKKVFDNQMIPNIAPNANILTQYLLGCIHLGKANTSRLSACGTMKVYSEHPSEVFSSLTIPRRSPMKHWNRALFTLLALLTLTTSALAQDTTEVPVADGLGLGIILGGIAAIVVVGLLMARRESGDGDDLV